MLVSSRVTKNLLHTLLQKGVSGDSEEESDNGGESDVSFFFCVVGFEPHITTVFQWTYKS